MAVEPALLASALGRLLELRGWQVKKLDEYRESPNRPVHALVVTIEDSVDAAGIDAEFTIVLPDAVAPGGNEARAGGAVQELGSFLEVIGPVG